MRRFLLIAILPFLASASAAQSRLPHSFFLRCVPQSTTPDGPVSSDVSHSPVAGWSVEHKLSDGRVFKREQQYIIRDERRYNGWEGILRKNHKLLMTGEAISSNGNYRYVERLYDNNKGGAQLIEIIENCSLLVSGVEPNLPVSNNSERTQNPINNTSPAVETPTSPPPADNPSSAGAEPKASPADSPANPSYSRRARFAAGERGLKQ